MNDKPPGGEDRTIGAELVESLREAIDILAGEATPARLHIFPCEGVPAVHLVVDDDGDDGGSAREAGTEFARISAGARPQDFAVSLAEQEKQIRRAITDAGFTAERAGSAACEFATAASVEWRRIADKGENGPGEGA